jgi:hypothetical protein
MLVILVCEYNLKKKEKKESNPNFGLMSDASKETLSTFQKSGVLRKLYCKK